MLLPGASFWSVSAPNPGNPFTTRIAAKLTAITRRNNSGGSFALPIVSIA